MNNTMKENAQVYFRQRRIAPFRVFVRLGRNLTVSYDKMEWYQGHHLQYVCRGRASLQGIRSKTGLTSWYEQAPAPRQGLVNAGVTPEAPKSPKGRRT